MSSKHHDMGAFFFFPGMRLMDEQHKWVYVVKSKWLLNIQVPQWVWMWGPHAEKSAAYQMPLSTVECFELTTLFSYQHTTLLYASYKHYLATFIYQMIWVPNNFSKIILRYEYNIFDESEFNFK